ncbi:uncharacterized mitochondrial protein-like protein, partial [Tanacetum coccineum]
TVLEQDSLSPGLQSQENVPQAAETVTTSNEPDLLFSLMFDELLNGTTLVVSKSSAVHDVDAPNKHQQHNTSTTTVANIIQAETNNEYAQDDDDEFVNVFSTPVQERGETSSRHVDSSNMHTFYQHHPSGYRWTKDHPLKQIKAMQEELYQFDRLDVWELVDRTLCKNVINMKWIWKNKRDEENTLIRNKARLVAKGYTQNEGIDFE